MAKKLLKGVVVAGPYFKTSEEANAWAADLKAGDRFIPIDAYNASYTLLPGQIDAEHAGWIPKTEVEVVTKHHQIINTNYLDGFHSAILFLDIEAEVEDEPTEESTTEPE